MYRFNKIFILFLVFECIGLVYALDQIDNLKIEISKISLTRQLAIDKTTKIKDEIADLAQVISKLKAEFKEEGNIFVRYRLEQVLKKSEGLDKKLKQEQNQLTTINEVLDEKNRELLKTYNKEINVLSDKLEKIKDKKNSDYAKLLKSLRDIVKEKETFIGLPTDLPIEFKAISVNTLDSSFEIYEKIDTLKDLTDKHKRQLFDIEERIKELKERQTLIKEIKHFNEEIAFFSDEFVMHRKPVTKDTSDKTGSTNAEGTSEENSEKNPDTTGTQGTTDESGNTEQTSQTTTPDTGTESAQPTEQTNETTDANLTNQIPATPETTPTTSKIVIPTYQSEIEFQRLTMYKNIPVREVIKSLEKDKKKILNAINDLQNKIKEFEKFAQERSQ